VRVAAAVRVVPAARIAAAGRVAKSGEQLSAVQLLRGVVTASLVSGSGKLGEQLSVVVMASMVNSE